MENKYSKIFYFQFVKLKKIGIHLLKKKRLVNEVRQQVKSDKVICALSGGVDSSVVALLVNKAIKKI